MGSEETSGQTDRSAHRAGVDATELERTTTVDWEWTAARDRLRARADERQTGDKTGHEADESTGPVVVTDDCVVQDVLDLMSDDRSRAILAATTETARSAREVAEECDLPLSTTYRKLEEMVEAGLLAERTRVRRAGKHPSEYRRVVDELVVTVQSEGETRIVVLER